MKSRHFNLSRQGAGTTEHIVIIAVILLLIVSLLWNRLFRTALSAIDGIGMNITQKADGNSAGPTTTPATGSGFTGGSSGFSGGSGGISYGSTVIESTSPFR